ncbi:uncharacterized protein BDZ99DRAFT_198125 [Mytilinidion resinicola]|uniref:Uncharacterized protein n=1 Tax=Mytilinidion resinicola TaxID=574789 RepID=A0A6A6Z400_9PEZI|nr:uncharacterized protein BDZ99DRAFT_198125 [Mytilinidion resinicola]KAF2815538.1 hypothetical protein BDZ99DRAFT_198125 [Mytilinidion resinicola]
MHTNPPQAAASPRSNPITHHPIPPPPYTHPNDRGYAHLVSSLTTLFHLLAISLVIITFIAGTAIAPGTREQSFRPRVLGDRLSILRISVTFHGWDTPDGQTPPYQYGPANPYEPYSPWRKTWAIRVYLNGCCARPETDGNSDYTMHCLYTGPGRTFTIRDAVRELRKYALGPGREGYQNTHSDYVSVPTAPGFIMYVVAMLSSAAVLVSRGEVECERSDHI